jgi:hypothetical protein
MEQTKTKKIRLTRGKYALIDAADFERVNQYKWFCDFADYAARDIKITGKHKRVWLHRWLLEAKKGEIVDHVNQDTLDNRRSNLRFCTIKQNCRNARLPVSNTTGYKGVRAGKTGKNFSAFIKVNRKQIHLGMYSTRKEAAKAYNRAALKYFGEYASLNPI